MLVLTRKLGEKINIGNDVTVTLLSISGKNVARIGIEAPKDVSVHREEITHKIASGEPEKRTATA